VQATNALLATRDSTNGIADNAFFEALNSDISISGGSLTISNHALNAGRSLSLSASSLLTDSGANAANFWQCGDCGRTYEEIAGAEEGENEAAGRVVRRSAYRRESDEGTA
jgi:hypothetical protein